MEGGGVLEYDFSMENINPWVQVEDPSNRLAEAHLFLDHLVVDRLYTELFLKVDSWQDSQPGEHCDMGPYFIGGNTQIVVEEL